MKETYTHTEQSTDQLTRRLIELSELEKRVHHGPERTRQLGHEAVCICFELSCRDLNGSGIVEPLSVQELEATPQPPIETLQ